MIRIETRRRRDPDIGIAPLVDCVLLLLVFFLLTSSFSENRGLTIDLPDSATARAAENANIAIRVLETGEIVLEGEPIPIGALATALRRVVARRGKRPVLIQADRRVPLGEVTKVIDSVRMAGLETVSIATRRVSPAEIQDQDE